MRREAPLSDGKADIRWIWLIAAGAAGALYVATAAPFLIWGDSGDAQLRLYLGQFYDRRWLSRCHILYYLLGNLFTLVGLSPAQAATMLSALAGAVTIGNVAVVIALLTKHRTPVVCGVVLLLASHCMWHIATVAEVMTLSTAMLSLELVLVIRFVQTRRGGWLVGAWGVNGLGLSVHNFALLTWPAYVVLLIHLVKHRAGVSWRGMVLGVVAWGVGASPVIALFVYLAREFGQPVDLLVRMLMGGYAANVFNVGLTLGLVAKTVCYTAYSFPTPLVLAAFVGISVQWRHGLRPLTLFLFSAFAVYFVFAARYNVPDQHVFLLHSFVILALFVGVGIDQLCLKHRSVVFRVALVAFACVAPLVYAVVPEVMRSRFPEIEIVPHARVPDRDPYTWFLKPWRCGDTGPERFARRTLDALPKRAVLTIDSTLAPPILYLQNAEHLRRDVRILGGEINQGWFKDKLDISDAALRHRLIDDQRLFTATTARRSWNGHLRGAEYDVVSHGPIYRFVRVRQPQATDTPD